MTSIEKVSRGRFSVRRPRPFLQTRSARSRFQVERLEERTLLSVTAATDTYGLLQDQPFQVPAPGVLANDSDTASLALSAAVATQPAHGTLTLGTNGSFVYTPAAGYTGPDSFTYTASDSQGASATGQVNLTVVPCTSEACVFAGPRLASLNTSQGVLTNAIVGGLLGTTVNLSAADWTGLANSQISGSRLLNQLQTNLGLATP
jgi:VCBS repeat-containing protein